LVIKYNVLHKLIIKSLMIYNVLNIISETKVRRTRGARHMVYIINSRNISNDIPPRKRPYRSKRKVSTKTGLR